MYNHNNIHNDFIAKLSLRKVNLINSTTTVIVFLDLINIYNKDLNNIKVKEARWQERRVKYWFDQYLLNIQSETQYFWKKHTSINKGTIILMNI